MYEKWTRNRPNIRIGLDSSAHRLSGLESSGVSGLKNNIEEINPKHKEHISHVNHNPKLEKSNNTKNTQTQARDSNQTALKTPKLYEHMIR